ncbi:flagellin [Bradyrhizobium sp.]|uniref:flagellin N-terminal helical domain-containing protein n=1 Tax=Bradyrhizobium sp. TaxID=376 RepID=UPI0023A40CB3|nr:flagellin [Bradyrhizobium sp.]MDE2379843.1 flagellar protein [Bradyrhizobium sp.]
MSDIVLSAAVRQNLLSLQSTANLLSTTQERLSTGKKVNTALDNPTNFFTAQGLDSRASDISNLLDGIGNGVQVLQAANTGITSLQKLVDSAKSVANQALQTQVGYSTRANVTSGSITRNGVAVDSTDLRGLGTVTNRIYTAGVINKGAGPGTIAATDTLASIGTGGTAIANGDVLVVNGKTIKFDTTTVTSQTSAVDAFGNTTFYLATSGTTPKVSDLLSAIDTSAGNTGTGSVASTVANSGAATSALQLNTGVNSDLTLAGTAAAKLGLTAGTYNRTGDTLTFTALGSGLATTVTFGDGTGGTVKTLNDLNTLLAGDNLSASINSSGQLMISTSNDYASFNMPTVAGTSQSGVDGNGAFQVSKGAVTVTSPIKDPVSQAIRQNLVTQYNNIIAQIDTTAQDASFNGVNLLNGDSLKLVFNETGKSTLTITGLTFNSGGLGLSNLVQGTDFIDNAATNRVLTSLNAASSTLRSQASTLGSNLSIVQIRQDFSKNLINVLQTGSSNLTLADTNEEAANSQALSTRQSIAVSALALANQSQQSVLQLLR